MMRWDTAFAVRPKMSGSRRPRLTRGFARTVMAASAATFLGVYGLLTPAGDTGRPGIDFAYYPNCAAARAAGVAPINSGEPGYRSKLDRDGDGIACEPHR